MFTLFLVVRCVTTEFGPHVWAAAQLRMGMGLVRSLPVLAFAYNAHFNVFSIYNAMDQRAKPHMGTVITVLCPLPPLHSCRRL